MGLKDVAVRLPVGYQNREVMSDNEAAAVGAGQRGFAGLPKQS